MSEENRVRFGTLTESIENKILESIRKGMSAGEHISIRPLREVFQNTDDEISDRFYIRIDKDALYFMNDGNRLTIEFNKDNTAVGGSCRMITGINMAFKKRDKNKAGNFGTGLRSAHAISHTIEIHGKTTQFIEIEEKDEFGDKKAKLWEDKPDGTYHGISNAYDKTLEEAGEVIDFPVRDKKARPKRVLLPTDLPRDGILIRLPWRRKIAPKSVDRTEWEELLWNDEKIKLVGELYIKEIPRILLGCSWLREVVLDINVGTEKARHAWVRDFNHREFEQDDGIHNGQLIKYKGKQGPLENGLTVNISTQMKREKVEEFYIVTSVNDSISSFADDAELLAPCHLIVPKNPIEYLPGYTPISLTGHSGNRFGPISYLPPDDSRTSIKIDGVKKAKQLWAAKAISSFSDHLLAEVLALSKEEFSQAPLKILQLLPRRKPSRWFTKDGSEMMLPNTQANDQTFQYTHQLQDAWAAMNQSWIRYTETASSESILKDQTGAWVQTNQVVNIVLSTGKHQKILARIIEKLGATVLTVEQNKVLSQLDVNDWGDCHPLRQMNSIESVLDLKEILEAYEHNLTVDALGIELIRELINLIHVNPPKEWQTDNANRNRIPCVPNAEGKLLPLIDERDNKNFYSDSEQFPDLIPDHRRIHKSIAPLAKHFNLSSPEPQEWSRLIDEGVTNHPKKFGDLANHGELHLQISKALGLMAQGNFPTEEMRNQKFIPCLHKGKIITRGLGRHGDDHVWPLDKIGKATRTSFYSRCLIFDDAGETRVKFQLHKTIQENLIWLELHPEAEEYRGNISSKLQLNSLDSKNPGVNLIRALIFALPIPNSEHKDKSVFYRYPDSSWELDKWIGLELSDDVRDEIFESLLKILRDASERTPSKGMSTGWGADSRDIVHSLHLLKNEAGEWSTLGNLCFDLRADLSDLFGKTAVLKKHRELLGHKVITSDVGSSGGAGLGITHRFDEVAIVEKIQKLSGTSPEVRSKILGMMLDSEEPWELDEDVGLKDMQWIPIINKSLSKFSKTLLPTPAIVELLGHNHPWFITTDVDCSKESVVERAKELGIQYDADDEALLQTALLSPDEIWTGLNGINILQHLQKIFQANNGFSNSLPLKRPRMPDQEGLWHNSSWLVNPEHRGKLQSLFPERNIITPAHIGGVDVAEMAKQWLLPKPCGPATEDLIEKLTEISQKPFAEINRTLLQNLWDLILSHLNENQSGFSLPPQQTKSFVIEVDSELTTLGDLFIVEDECSMLVSRDVTATQTSLNEAEPLSDILESHFNVLNLASSRVSDLKFVISEIDNSNPTPRLIERYWIILASLRRYNDLVHEQVWLYKSATQYGFTRAQTTFQQREAVIPEKEDTKEELHRMTTERLSLLWLPRDGEISNRIYEQLDRVHESRELPFLSVVSKPEATSLGDEDKEDWPYLTKALQNILEAVIRTENHHFMEIKTIQAYKTTNRISSDLYAQTTAGHAKVKWKESSMTESIMLDVNREEERFELTVCVSGATLDDQVLADKLASRIAKTSNTKSKNFVKKLTERDESHWENLNPELVGFEESIHVRPLISTGMHKEYAGSMESWYNGCQVCSRQTPMDRNGASQEGVVSLFRERGGRYYSDSIPYLLGNVMYLCPVHKSLYSRSKFSDLMWIPVIDKARQEIQKSPTKEKVSQMVDSILKGSGEIRLNVHTYEKEPDDGEPGPTEKIRQVTWHKKHASGFRDALTQYLTGLIN